jgi:hypothetical protein
MRETPFSIDIVKESENFVLRKKGIIAGRGRATSTSSYRCVISIAAERLCCGPEYPNRCVEERV